LAHFALDSFGNEDDVALFIFRKTSCDENINFVAQLLSFLCAKLAYTVIQTRTCRGRRSQWNERSCTCTCTCICTRTKLHIQQYFSQLFLFSARGEVIVACW